MTIFFKSLMVDSGQGLEVECISCQSQVDAEHGLQEDHMHFLPEPEPDELNPNGSLNFIFLHLGWGGSCLFMRHFS